MKKAIITLLCIIGCLQMNAQRVYTEEGKYYEMGYVEYGTSSKSASATAAFILPRSDKVPVPDTPRKLAKYLGIYSKNRIFAA